MRNPFRRSGGRSAQSAASNVHGPDGTWYPPMTTGAGTTRSALARMQSEERSTTSLPWNVGDPLSTTPGVAQATALTLAAVYSATDLLATSVATLPVKAYTRRGDVRVCLDTLPELFERLVNEGRIVTWLRQAMTSLLLRGNAFGLIVERDNFGYPTHVVWLSPDHVQVQDQMVSGRGSYLDPLWTYLGQPIAAENLIHIPWYVVPEQVMGLSPIAAFATTIGVGLSAQTYGSDWFDTGGFPPGTFKNSEVQITQEEAAGISSRLTGAMRARRPLVYGRDWTYTPITVPPEEAQFVETMRLTATQIAAIYHVPAEWIGGQTGGQGLHYSTAEQDMIQMVTLGVRPYIELLESVFFGLMPHREYVRFNVDALLRADLKTRHEVYAIDASIGLRTIDEMRAQEDWEPLPPTTDDADHAETLDIGEMVRKLYLGVDVFLTPDEARELLNRAGADLPIPGDLAKPEPEPSTEDTPPAPTTMPQPMPVNGARWSVPT